jgi:RNA polymerase sigma factor (sigma-70 family)
MPATQLKQVVHHLRGVVARQQSLDLNDFELWQRFVHERDEAAFDVLVHRHGPMVLGVCRRVLRHEQDAEDAFQATFLVLVRKAPTLQSPSRLANWLHGVAYRTALEAKCAAARRRDREAKAHPPTEMSEDPLAELWPVLDQELQRLGEKYRAVVVLCDLEGKTRQEAARQLGLAEGTVASRLARARRIVAKALARRGFASALVAAALTQRAASASVAAERVVSTITSACLSAVQAPAANAVLSAKVIALAEGVLKTMLLTKLKIGIAVFLVLGIAVLGTRGLISRALAADSEAVQAQGQASPDNVDKRVAELKQKLQEMQKQLASLEQEIQTKGKPDVSFLADRFKYRVPFEIGRTQTREGGRIEIREVWGTRPKIEEGGQYLVRGKYVIPAGVRGRLYFYATAGGAWGAVTTTLDLQSVTLDKPEGEFALVHGMSGPGSFHLIATEEEKYSRYFANVYFGTGDNVYR